MAPYKLIFFMLTKIKFSLALKIMLWALKLAMNKKKDFSDFAIDVMASRNSIHFNRDELEDTEI